MDEPSACDGWEDAVHFLEDAWRAHADEVRRRCIVWMGGHADEAREAFSRAWTRAAASYMAARPSLLDRRAWLLTFAYRACMDLHRERVRRGEETLDSTGASSGVLPRLAGAPRDPEGMMLDRELAAVLLAAVDDLPPRLRGAMHTYMRSGDYRDVSERFGITVENARKRIQQGRAVLRNTLRDYQSGRTPRSLQRRGGRKFRSRSPRPRVFPAPTQQERTRMHPMQIDSFTPNQGPPGTAVTIDLSDMPADASFANTAAFLAGTPVDVGNVTLNLDENATGTVDVTIGPDSQTGTFLVVTGGQNDNAQSADEFTVQAAGGPPIVTSMNPQAGTPGKLIALNGQNLAQVTGISVGGTTVLLFITHSAAQLSFMIPMSVAAGAHDVRLRTPAGVFPCPFQLTVIGAEGEN